MAENEKQYTGVRWSIFIVVVLFLCAAIIAVGLGIYFGLCYNKNDTHTQPATLPQTAGSRIVSDGQKLVSDGQVNTYGTVQQPTGWQTVASGPQVDYRLPQVHRPITYDLQVQPYFPADGVTYRPDKNFTFDGHVTITFECTTGTNSLVLHMHKLTLKNETVQLVDQATNQKMQLGDRYSYDQRTQIVTFRLQGYVFTPGHKYTFSVAYAGELVASDLAGFYPSSYMENGVRKWLAVTQFEPTDARRALPCFDEPHYKAIYTVTLVHPSTMKALSNSMEKETTVVGHGWSMTSFQPTLNMSSYLLAFAVCGFQAKINYTSDNGTLFRVWARPSLINATDYAAEAGPKMLDFYARYFNIAFPLQKQDMLALPDFAAGAMENWGLITYRESALLYDESTYASSNRQRVAVVIAHELSHQWFGDLVTMKWWDDLWLNEGFARYMEYFGADIISDGAFHMDQQFIANMDSAMRFDQLPSSHPIFVPVSTPDEINAIFDDISYNKGGTIIKMLNYTLTEPVFRAGLHIYLSRHAYGNAGHEDLWRAFTEVVNGTILDWNDEPLNVSEYMNPWILQMGYPVLNVNRVYGNDSPNMAIITQQRFLLPGNYTVRSGASYEQSYNYTWYVPIWYQSAENLSSIQFVWLKPNENRIIQSGDDTQWLLLNYESAGYYRVNYDEKNWRLLQIQLQTDFTIINIKNRAQMMDDVFNLARCGCLSYDIALNTTLYLTNETVYPVWKAAMDGFSYLEDMFAVLPEYDYFTSFLKKLLYPVFITSGWNDEVNSLDDVLPHYMRAMAANVLCQLGHPQVLEKALADFNTFAKACNSNDSVSATCSPVSTNLRKTVYCAGAAQGDGTSWKLLWRLHSVEQVAVEKDNLMYGLCCTKSPRLLKRLLDEATDANSKIVRRQDARYVFSYIGGNEVGRLLLWSYFEENWTKIRKLSRSGFSGLNTVLNAVTRSFNTEFQAQKLQSFYAANADQFGASSTGFKQQLERVQANVEWMNNFKEQVVDWFRHQDEIMSEDVM